MKTTDFLGNEWDFECMGCAISNMTMLVPGGFIHKTQNFCVHQDPLIPLPGLLVIASVRHIRTIIDMQASEFEEFSKLLRITHAAIRNAMNIEYLTIIQEESSKHFHFWFFPWTQPVIETYGAPSLSKIRDIMAAYKKRPVAELEWTVLETSIEKIKQSWCST